MHTPRVLTARQAADLVHDGDIVTVSSSSGLGCPDAVLAGLGQRYEETRSPKNLTSIHPIAAGDMWGIKGIDHIARPGLLSRVVAGSYPSGPSSAEPPRIWQMIENNEIEAYNFPSGVLYQLHRAAAAKQPGVLSKVGLDTFVDPRISAGRMNTVTPDAFVRVHELDGQEWLFYDALVPNVAIIRATTADTHGNLTFEEEASPLGALDLAYAAHNNGGVVIAQVKYLAEGGSLSPQAVQVPGILVDAWSWRRISCRPPRPSTTRQSPGDATSAEHPRAGAVHPREDHGPPRRGRVAVRGDRQPRLRCLRAGAARSGRGGIGRRGVLGDRTGPVGGVPLLDFVFGVAQNPDAIMQSSDQFTLLQGGGFEHSLLSFLEIDQHATSTCTVCPSAGTSPPESAGSPTSPPPPRPSCSSDRSRQAAATSASRTAPCRSGPTARTPNS